jgi:hypothetical protein
VVRLRPNVGVAFRSPDVLVLEDGDDVIELQHPAINEILVASLRSGNVPAETGPASLESTFAKLGLLRDPRLDEDPVPVLVAGEHIRRLLDQWVDEIYSDALWDPLLNSDGAGSLLFGWVVENYHFSRAAFEHLSDAVCRSETPDLSRRFLEHLGQEWDHPQLFLQASRAIAAAAGRSASIENSRPLAATAAAVRHLRRATTLHPFVYKTCVSVLERTAAKVDDTRSFYHQAIAKQGLSLDCVQPLIAHAEADEQFAHLDSISEFAEFFQSLPLAVVQLALEEGRQFVEVLNLWQASIAKHYGPQPLGLGACMDDREPPPVAERMRA